MRVRLLVLYYHHITYQYSNQQYTTLLFTLVVYRYIDTHRKCRIHSAKLSCTRNRYLGYCIYNLVCCASTQRPTVAAQTHNTSRYEIYKLELFRFAHPLPQNGFYICRRIIYRRYFQICERATDDIVCCLLACTITVPSELLFKVIDVAGDAKLIPPTGKKLIIRLKSRLRYSYSLYEYIRAYEEYINRYIGI